MSHPHEVYISKGIDKIQKPEDKLNEIHKIVKFENGTMKDEFNEQVMSAMFLTGNEKVLEIGAHKGRNTLAIATMLNDDTQFVTLETDKAIFKDLVNNRDINNFRFHCENKALSLRKLRQHGMNTLLDSESREGYEVQTITWDELNQKYNIPFDTLVLDCEGSFYYILKDMPTVLDNIKLIIMENDYPIYDRKQYLDDTLKEKGFSRVYCKSGGFQPCFNNFWEVWKR
jgi:FkbM family methyltransferase